MPTIFPFLISYDTISEFILNITNNMPVSTETMVIAFILINFINIWFIITITKMIIRTIKKIINIMF